MNGIDKMTAMILSEAEAERDAKLEKASAEAEGILTEYRKKAEAIKASEAEKAAQEAEALLERAAASAAKYERNKLLESRATMLDRAYSGALDALCSDENAAKPEYLAMLKRIFDSVLTEQLAAEKTAEENDPYGEYSAPECYLLRLSGRDKSAIGAELIKYAQSALKKTGKKVALDEKEADIQGGFIMVCGDVELNASLELYMNTIRSATEGEICGVLFV